MRRGAVIATWALSLGGLLLLLELSLRLLPVSTASMVQTDPLTGRRFYPPGHQWTQSTGWDLRNAQRMRAGASGYAGNRDLRELSSDGVLLIGDSFVEASMLPEEHRLAAQIEAQTGRAVAALGTPGSSLLDYAERLRWAMSLTAARDVVMLISISDVREAICQAKQHEMRCLDGVSGALREPDLRPPAGPVKELLRRSALAQYLFSQLMLEPRALWERLRQQAQPAQGHEVGKALMPAPAPSDRRSDPLLEKVE